MPITLNGDTGILTPMYNGTISSNAVTPSVNMKSRIINGAMVIDQRNAGASVTPTNGQYGVDRWQAYLTQASKFSMQQSSTAPAGFKNSLLVTSLSAYSVVAGDFFNVLQFIEGFNVADLDWGTANAKTVTLSFWVRSSLTGNFGGVVRNTGGGTRSYPFSYTISSANTFEYKTITIPGDTTGSWNTTNGQGVGVVFDLGVGATYEGTAGAWANSNLYGTTGATSLVGTNGATFYITGVQLEVGSTATSFDYRPYGTELALCQRYYERITGAADCYDLISAIYSTGNNWAYWQYKVTKRASATVTPTGFNGTNPTAYAPTVSGAALSAGSPFYLSTGSITASSEL